MLKFIYPPVTSGLLCVPDILKVALCFPSPAQIKTPAVPALQFGELIGFSLIALILYLKKLPLKVSFKPWFKICSKNLFQLFIVNNFDSQKKQNELRDESYGLPLAVSTLGSLRQEGQAHAQLCGEFRSSLHFMRPGERSPPKATTSVW